MHYANFHLIITTLVTYAVHYSDGCSRTPARPKPTPSTLPPDGWWSTATTTFPTTSSGRGQFDLVCDKDEEKRAACLHGGECFVIEILDVRSAHCKCKKGWAGLRCQNIDSGFFVLPSNVKAAGIATGAVAVAIIITIIIVYLIIRKRHMRMRRNEKRSQANGNVCKSLIQDGAIVEYQYPSYPPYDYTSNEKSETNV